MTRYATCRVMVHFMLSPATGPLSYHITDSIKQPKDVNVIPTTGKMFLAYACKGKRKTNNEEF